MLLLRLSAPPSLAQTAMTEVPLDKKFDKVTVLNFKPPYRTMTVYMEDDADGRYSTIDIPQTALFLKRFKKIEKVKVDDKITPSAVVSGMKIDLYIEHYQRSLKNIAKEVVLADDYYGTVNLKGLYEFLDGQRASVDGQSVMLDKNTVLKGQEEWKDKKFASFSELQLGCELNLHGQRETDGIIYVTRGTARPIEENPDDLLLRRGIDLGMKVDKNQLSVGTMFKRTFITDNTLQDYVNSIGRKIVPAYIRTLPIDHPDHIDFKYYLVDDPSLNASAFPNGTVVIHTGLVRNMTNEAQLASVIAHEIAHVTQKHQAKNYRNRKNWKNVSNALTIATTLESTMATTQQNNQSNRQPPQNRQPARQPAQQGSATSSGILPGTILGILSEMYVSQYSRTQEMQADRIGLRYMYDAGYDPREAANIWKKLAQEEATTKSDVEAKSMMLQMMNDETKDIPEKPVPPEKRESIYASHPRSRDRFNHVNFLLSTAYANANFSSMTVNADEHRNMVGLLKGSSKTNRASSNLPASGKSAPTRSSTARKKPKP